MERGFTQLDETRKGSLAANYIFQKTFVEITKEITINVVVEKRSAMHMDGFSNAGPFLAARAPPSFYGARIGNKYKSGVGALGRGLNNCRIALILRHDPLILCECQQILPIRAWLN